MFLLLIVLVVLLAVAVFVLFHHHMVNLHQWHAFLASAQAESKTDIAELKQYFAAHIHATAAPIASAPAKT